MKKLKLAIVTPYPPGKGTLNEYAYHLVNHFLDKEDIGEISLISEKLPQGKSYGKIDANFPVHVKEVWSFNSIFNLVKIFMAVKRSRADIVLFNIHFLSFGDKKIPAALGLMLPMLCRLFGTKSIVLLHNIIETVDLKQAGITGNRLLNMIFNAFGTLLTWMLLQSNMVCVTISKYVEILEAKYGAKNVALIPHGSFELPSLPDFNQTANPMKVMSFGKFGTYKKVEEMIEAVELVRKRRSADIEIVIAGTDSPNRVGYLQEIKAKYSNIPDMTFTGYVEEEDVPTVFLESTVVVFPYTSTTGSSGVLHQAGSYGKACILPNIGDLKALIEEEGYAGEYFEPADIESLANAIETMLFDEDKRIANAKSNYAAAASLPMADIADWYLLHFNRVRSKFSPSVKKMFKLSSFGYTRKEEQRRLSKAA